MGKATFKNEFTYKHFLESGKESEFDRLFNEAAEKAASSFGSEHPIHVGQSKIFSESKIIERSPIDSRLIGTFQKGTREHARQAVAEAQKAFTEWSGLDYRDRIYIFKKAASLLSERKFLMAAILSYENGKSRYESIGEVDEGIDFMRYYANEMESNKGYVRKTSITSKYNYKELGFQGAPASEKIRIVMKPYGVFGVISPFNFPLSISIGMSTGALITGNTVVYKPSCTDNMSMLTGLKIYELFRDAGLPAGAFSFVTGPGSVIGEELIANNGVSGIAFTGSKETGLGMLSRSISSSRIRQFIMEMGGKNPVIVSKSADLETAANGIVSAAFGYSGQKCSALSRLYVHESIKEALVGKVIEKTRTLKIGNPIEKGVYIGPLINETAYRRYAAAISKARSSSVLLYGGNEVKTGLKGFYVEPAIIEAKHDNELVKKELFLPIITVETFKDLKEAIRLANDTEFGLTAGFYGKKKSEINEFMENIEAGTIYINRAESATTGAIVGVHAFVGWKSSGLTGRGTGSKEYLQQFMREQSVSIS